MKILLIGGTGFLGSHIVRAAQVRNHEVTIFHRSHHTSAGRAVGEEIFGDRTDELFKLANRRWDAVIDTCGYLPHTVRASATALRDAVGQYVFISSVAAYADFSTTNYAETTPLATLTAKQTAEANHLTAKANLTAGALADLYGGLKALCEAQVQQVFGSRTLLIRPGLLVGPDDATDRFTYWAWRVARGGEVLAPGRSMRYVQFVDVRDVADWLVALIERGVMGPYNVTGHPFALSFGRLLEAMKEASGSQAVFTWVDEAFLQREQVAPWSELPLYLPESSAATAGFLSANIARARAEGLTFRPLQATIQDTLAWRATQESPLKAGLSAAREQELLAKYALL